MQWPNATHKTEKEIRYVHSDESAIASIAAVGLHPPNCPTKVDSNEGGSYAVTQMPRSRPNQLRRGLRQEIFSAPAAGKLVLFDTEETQVFVELLNGGSE